MVKRTLKAVHLARLEPDGIGELRLFRVFWAAAIIIGETASAMAAIPSPALLGVDRVVIECAKVEGLSDVERRAFCEQLVKKADTLTDLPVSLASAADLDPTNLAGQARHLLLRVTATATPVEAGRKSVSITVVPVRAARPTAEETPAQSSISLVNVAGHWVLQGPLQSFDKVLGPTRGRHLRAPLTAD